MGSAVITGGELVCGSERVVLGWWGVDDLDPGFQSKIETGVPLREVGDFVFYVLFNVQ